MDPSGARLVQQTQNIKSNRIASFIDADHNKRDKQNTVKKTKTKYIIVKASSFSVKPAAHSVQMT